MKTVFSFAKPYKAAIIIALLLMLIELSVELLQPMFIAKIIDEGIAVGDEASIWKWGGLMMLLAILAFASGVINSYFASHAAHSFSYDLRNALFKKVQSFKMATHVRIPAGGLITRLTNDVTQVQNVLFMSLRFMLRAPLLVIGSMIMAFFVDAYLAMFLVVSVPFLLLFLYWMVRKGVSYFGLVQKRFDRVNRVLQENLQAVRLVKAYLRGTYEASRFEKVAGLLQMDTVKALRIMEVILPTLLFVMNGSLIAVLWFGALEVNDQSVQIGELVAIINYAMRMTGAFSMFSFIIVAFARAKASAERIEEVLLIHDGVEVEEASKVIQLDTKARIEFDNVSFSYPYTTKPVLQNISFICESGEKVAIMGATGAGKSTLLNLILRFYEAEQGTIYINNKDVKDWSLKQLRNVIGLVPQQSVLFTGTIQENITWGKSDAREVEVHEATKQSQIHDAVVGFPNGYETRVGQKGVNLSGGQKQRLSIARALIRKPQILLFDDSTSALDVKTEAALWKALEGENATMLVVTQKIQTAKGADRILLLEQGRVSAFGTHDELLQESPLYQKIAHSQLEQEGIYND